MFALASLPFAVGQTLCSPLSGMPMIIDAGEHKVRPCGADYPTRADYPADAD